MRGLSAGPWLRTWGLFSCRNGDARSGRHLNTILTSVLGVRDIRLLSPWITHQLMWKSREFIYLSTLLEIWATLANHRNFKLAAISKGRPQFQKTATVVTVKQTISLFYFECPTDHATNHMFGKDTRLLRTQQEVHLNHATVTEVDLGL